MTKNIIISIILLFLFSGCASTNPTTLRKDASGTYAYKVNVNYKTVYSRIALGAKRCLEPFTTMSIHPIIFEDNKSAEVSASIQQHTVLVIDIGAIDDHTTEVRTYYPYSLDDSWKETAKDSQKWALGQIEVCRIQE